MWYNDHSKTSELAHPIGPFPAGIAFPHSPWRVVGAYIMSNTVILKWLISALTALVMFFGGLYVTSVTDTQQQLTEQLINHESRITTMEESQKNQKESLDEVKRDVKDVAKDVKDIRDAILKTNR